MLGATIVSCSPNTTFAPTDAGADIDAMPLCDGLSICVDELDCAGEEMCADAWCWSDKDAAAHWCMPKDGGL